MELVFEWEHGVVGEVSLGFFLQPQEELLVQDHTAANTRAHSCGDSGVDEVDAAQSTAERANDRPPLSGGEAIEDLEQRTDSLLAPVDSRALLVLQESQLHARLTVEQE